MIPLPAELERFRGLGATINRSGTFFRVWSTKATRVQVRLYRGGGEEPEAYRDVDLFPDGTGDGFFSARLDDVSVGCRYRYLLDGVPYPDPYTRSLPEGVHGPSEIIDPHYAFQYPKRPAPREGGTVVYEIHVGTFTPEGTFAAAREKLPALVELGITAVQLMPVSSFPGRRGWGYDGAAHYATHAGYGTLKDLQAFVDEAHRLELTVLLDVVYNHFGPDGNYLRAFSDAYFTHAILTPWGDSPDYQHPAMRSYLLGNALFWLDEAGFDGFRLDATQHIHDESPVHILRQLSDLAHGLREPAILVAEDWRNVPSIIHDWGLDGILADDFHHQSRVLLTGEDDGYYAGYRRAVEDLARTIERGWLYEGQVWHETQKSRGESADSLSAASLFYCLQNHDQVGNRPHGERLHHQVSLEAFQAVSSILLFLPMTPLLFMGQEWAASSPFLFFADLPGELGAMVTKGRREEFKGFRGFSSEEQALRIPDPQAETTFRRSLLDWSEREKPGHRETLDLYKRWLRLRREDPVLRVHDRKRLAAGTEGNVLWIKRWSGANARLLLVNFGEAVRLESLQVLPKEREAPWLTTSASASPEAVLAPYEAVLFAE